jgi:hypothetical protein
MFVADYTETRKVSIAQSLNAERNRAAEFLSQPNEFEYGIKPVNL